MSAGADPRSLLVRASILAALLGIAACLPLLIRETPYTFVLFMFVAQPLLAVAFLLFTVKVFRDLRSGHLL
ncbi:MAG: hypothetical protein M3R62_14330 [Acidobacteriota bacterium]|nr:hypothetical protein [Acidobacteriota bacterium]